jgi:hypothetical protein
LAIYPKIRDVKPLPDKRLQLLFDNGETKIYDCRPLLKETTFDPLKDDTLFQCIQVDANGYGVVWDENIDLSEAEL